MYVKPFIRIPLLSKRVRYGLVVIVAAVVLLASVEKPMPGTVSYGPFGRVKMDKWRHGIGYAVLTATIAYAYVAPVRIDRRRLVLSVCVAVAFGVCMELVQWPLPYRTLSAFDAIANAIGACCTAAVWVGLSRTVQFVEFDGVGF